MSETAIWNRYWQSDRIASCFDEAGARNYDDSIAGGWRSFFATLGNGARIIDLCTGNGAVALMAAQAGLAGGKGFRVTAVDQAEIDPAAHVPRHRRELETIDFRARTPVEALPFEDDSFDVAISQYGIEYSDLDRSLAELGRIVRPGGCVRLVLHAAEGAVCADAKRVIDEADFLLETVDLPGTARRCFLAVTQAERKPDASEDEHREARESLAAFESALTETARRLPAATDKTMLRKCGAVLFDTFKRHQRLDVDQLIDKVEEVRTNLLDHRGRLQALVDAAVGRAAVAKLAASLDQAGIGPIRHSDLRNDSGLIGYVVETNR